jgi:hypothetical protein
MAEVVGGPPQALLRIGDMMGLPPKLTFSDDYLRRIYITVIRQNWHLLPEEQIIHLLGWTSDRFTFTLKEDDFLDVKLGIRKPACEKLVYHPPTAEEQRKAEWVRATIQRHFGSSLSEAGEKRLQFVRDLSSSSSPGRRDNSVHAVPGELDLSTQWSVVAQEAHLRVHAERFARYMETAMGCKVPLAKGARRILLLTDPAVEAGDGFDLNASPSQIRIAGHGEAGVLQGLYWLQDQMEQREAPLIRVGEVKRRPVWNLRFLYSYFALYGDPLMQPDADPFPEAYLERLARVGINGVWIQAVLNTLVPSKAFPEFGAGSGTRLKSLRALAERASRFGMKVYLYLNEPRAMPAPFFERHPDVKGASYQSLHAMCTSVPAVREWITAALAHIFQHVPELGGVVTITMSENHTNCFSHGGAWGAGAPNAGDCPRCTKGNSWDTIAELLRAFHEGVRLGSPSAVVIAWDWGWGDLLARNLIPLLPRDVLFQSISEWDQPVLRGGVSTKVGEYSMSVVGPGPRARENWQRARSAGLQTMAKVQFNNTWEISAVPYIPVVELILDHCENLTREQISGVLASWTCGGYPSPNLEAVKAFYSYPRPPRGEILASIATQRYGRLAAASALEAWKRFSDAFLEFPYGVHIYVIPTQHGPANLLRLSPTGYQASMMLFPHDDYRRWVAQYPPEIAKGQFEKLASMWRRGLSAMEQVVTQASSLKKANARQDLAIALTCYHHFQSCANQIEFYLLRDHIAHTERKDASAIDSLRGIVRAEMELARQQYRVAKSSSVIGYEASNHYYYTPLDLVEKVLNCEQTIDELDAKS